MKRILLIALLLSAGCYRTNYSNLTPEGASMRSSYASSTSRWQNFFVWGLVPGTMLINGGDICSGAEVTEIKTLKTAPQVIMNIFVPSIAYDPWTGKVHCSEPR